MRKYLVVGAVAVALAGAGTAVAVGQQAGPQTTFTVEAKVSPNRAGTPKRPQPVRIRASAEFFHVEGVEKPIVTHGYALFPRNGDYNAHLLPRCSKRTLDQYGPDRCPKRSRIGAAKASAYADDIITYPTVEVFNGGPRVAWAYVTMYRPALVREAIAARIQELKVGKWKYRVTVRIPRVLQVVAGVPIAPRSIRGWVGRGKLIVTTSCPRNRRWPFLLKGYFTEGPPHTYRDSVRCKPPRRGR
ncbi:MAG: hypothetical protein GXY03_00400 [Solirubrobacterales bacterium]|nr:hypothetical protein [Solirubrobacterales bacterium]